MLDVAHADPVDDTGDRLAQSVPRRSLDNSALLRSCVAATCIWKAHGRARGRVHTAERGTSSWQTFAITSKSFYFSLRLAHFASRLSDFSTTAMRAASWRLRLGFVSEVDVLHLRGSPLVFAVETGESVSVTWAASREGHCEQKERQ